MTDSENDRYGFTWGNVKVTRMAEITRPTGTCRVLSVSSDKVRLEIYVSPTGRSVRVYRNGTELVAESDTAEVAS